MDNRRDHCLFPGWPTKVFENDLKVETMKLFIPPQIIFFIDPRR